MIKREIPSDQEVVDALRKLGDRVTARRLCEALTADGHPLRQSQLAIQRASERGRIEVFADWTLGVAREVLAA